MSNKYFYVEVPSDESFSDPEFERLVDSNESPQARSPARPAVGQEPRPTEGKDIAIDTAERGAFKKSSLGGREESESFGEADDEETEDEGNDNAKKAKVDGTSGRGRMKMSIKGNRDGKSKVVKLRVAEKDKLKNIFSGPGSAKANAIRLTEEEAQDVIEANDKAMWTAQVDESTVQDAAGNDRKWKGYGRWREWVQGEKKKCSYGLDDGR
ncbi:hypothetical protein K470DRAFT_268937 [Piedraia hortae CBS 480.64]|uniref:Uncharacterized protein n=1 Tax=Piedraia hortae CBS 480.64 TaxID=1314780 RepID=A0A6A7C551_9PEZI|nr:hypothetical protein K470DRAFT_268937 [Piedraia hortae CBS 480.64]